MKNRLNGQLAISRSIGDLKYRPAVTSEAETQTISLSSLDQYLILASDGVCSKVFNKKQVTDFISKSIQEGRPKEWISQEIVNEAIRNGSQDNITVMIVDLAHYYNNSVCISPSGLRSNPRVHSFSVKESGFSIFKSTQGGSTGRKSEN